MVGGWFIYVRVWVEGQGVGIIFLLFLLCFIRHYSSMETVVFVL